MGVRLLLAGAALAVVWPPAPIRTPTKSSGPFSAWLELYIATKTEEQGKAEVKVVVTLQGPSAPEVRGDVQVEDVAAGWHVDQSKPITGPTSWTETILLKQVKPDRVPFPALRVTLRGGPEEEWQTIDWKDVLHNVVVTLKPAEVSAAPSFWQRWHDPLRWTAAGVAVAGAVFWIVRRSRRRPRQPLDAVQRATRELDAAAVLAATDTGAACAVIAAVLRRFLSERWQLAENSQTTAEFLDALQARSDVPESLRDLFEKCDLGKFAGIRPDAEECRRMVEEARRVVADKAPLAPSGESVH